MTYDDGTMDVDVVDGEGPTRRERRLISHWDRHEGVFLAHPVMGDNEELHWTVELNVPLLVTLWK